MNIIVAFIHVSNVILFAKREEKNITELSIILIFPGQTVLLLIAEKVFIIFC